MLINKVSDDACQWNGHDVVISIGGIFFIERFVCCMTHEEKLSIQWPCSSDLTFVNGFNFIVADNTRTTVNKQI